MAESGVTTPPLPALRGHRVGFTGTLSSMTRKQAQNLVRESGGRVTESVTNATTLLVVGMDGWPLLADGRLSNKLQKAQNLAERGSRLKVLSEVQFLEFIGKLESHSDSRKSMNAQQVCGIVGIKPDMLSRWELLGLVRPHDGLYDFQDMVSLQTVAALVAQGASPQIIGRSVRSLSQILPGTERPLAQLKLLAEQNTLVAEVNGALVSPTGQFLIRFEDDGLEPDEVAEPISITGQLLSQQKTADEWFELGSEYEEEGDLESAVKAYRSALQQQPQFPSAHFNLANVLAAQGLRQAAEERYRVAIEQDRDLVEAWYNLADLLDDQDRTEEAIECLRAAVRVSPEYADAHYNLAFCCEKTGLADEAREHWQAYVRLAPSSEWSVFARRRLSG
jgi:tetratricopeptide (TPR) repeat protein